MIGMIDGNGHPWSWSAIINGYDREKLAACPYPVIPQYLNARPDGTVRIPEAFFTHLWTDRWEEASAVASATLISHVVKHPEDVSCKTWERYGIHLLEPVFRILGHGIVSIRLEASSGLEIAHLVHVTGAEVTLPVIKDGGIDFGTMNLCGTTGQISFKFKDTYTGFRRQLVSFFDYVRSGIEPYPFAETVELMSILIAGITSKNDNGRRVLISEIQSQLST